MIGNGDKRTSHENQLYSEGSPLRNLIASLPLGINSPMQQATKTETYTQCKTHTHNHEQINSSHTVTLQEIK